MTGHGKEFMKTRIQTYSPRTLIVDDSETFLTSLRRALTLQGVVDVVGTATDGREALEKAGTLTPDLVLMDLNMPELDGLQTTLLLRQQAPNSRIIIMTAIATAALSVFCQTHGAHGFIAKQSILHTLAAEIQRLFPAVPHDSSVST
jgi:DNA-binding NarL/FixJ family response regulator